MLLSGSRGWHRRVEDAPAVQALSELLGCLRTGKELDIDGGGEHSQPKELHCINAESKATFAWVEGDGINFHPALPPGLDLGRAQTIPLCEANG